MRLEERLPGFGDIIDANPTPEECRSVILCCISRDEIDRGDVMFELRFRSEHVTLEEFTPVSDSPSKQYIMTYNTRFACYGLHRDMSYHMPRQEFRPLLKRIAHARTNIKTSTQV